MSRPDVSIVIVSYNTRDLTLRCLRSSSTAAPRTSGSTSPSSTMPSVDGSADAIAEHFPEVRLLRLPENVGWGRGVNRGAVARVGE